MMIRVVAAAVLGAGTLMMAAQPAQAYWTRWGWREPVVVVPPRVITYGPRPPIWVRPHYDGLGSFIPGHWR